MVIEKWKKRIRKTKGGEEAKEIKTNELKLIKIHWKKYEKATALSVPLARGYIKRPTLLVVSADASTRLLLRLELFVDLAAVVSCLFTAQEVHEMLVAYRKNGFGTETKQ